MQGRITKAIAGFYYVYVAESGIYECKARGVFRKELKKPLVGDEVRIEVISEEEKTGNVVELLPRKNELLRPPVANVDQVLILFSMRTPDPNLILLDRFLIAAKRRGIDCIVGFNKIDTATEEEKEALRRAYRGSGVPLYFFSLRTGEGFEEVKACLKGKNTVLAGPSGVGKSSFTNAVQSRVRMEVGDISRKLARGKNTTRHCELIYVEEGTFLFDTPGFSALDTVNMPKEELERFYEEFHPYLGSCYYQGCAHLSEPDCAVKDALAAGAISSERYEQYCYLYEELREMERRQYR